MVQPVSIDAPDGEQRELFDRWAQVYADAATDAFGEDHDAWSADQLRELRRSPDRRRLAWAALDGRQVVGSVELVLPLRDNLSLAQLRLAVAPGNRRRGVGSSLLRFAEEQAVRLGRSVFVAETQWAWSGRDESGEGFAARRGYAAAQTVLRSSLRLSGDVAERARLERCRDGRTSTTGARAYELRTWWDEVPTRWLADRAELSQRMSTDIPLGELRLEEERWDEARVRQVYEQAAAMGRRVVDTAAVERSTGRLVGYTQVQVSTADPEVGYQQDTLVVGEHRGHGLGLRMKAANALALLKQSPSTRVVRTWNADDNHPMLAVNDTLGCTRDGYLREWQKVA